MKQLIMLFIICLYLNLRHNMDEMNYLQMIDTARQRVDRYTNYLDMNCGTETARKLWKDRIGYHLEYYRRLEEQMSDMLNFCNELSINI